MCQACQVRNQECVWPDLAKKANAKRVLKPSTSTSKRIPPPTSTTILDIGSATHDHSKSITTTPNGTTSSNLSFSTKSASPTPTSTSTSTSSVSFTNRATTGPSWKYDASLLYFDPALMVTTLPMSSTRNDTGLKSVVDKSQQQQQLLLHSILGVLTGMVDFDNEHEEAMDDVGHLNMNVLLT